jgi:regulator of sigma E protease
MDFFSGILDYVSAFGFNTLWFLVVLTVLVFFHELGHYAVARWCGVRVVVFSIGFGGEIFGWNDSHGTRWKVSWVPLGGYVKFFGDANAASVADHSEMTEDEKAVSFHHKAVPQRAAVVAAGPIANFVLAMVLLAGLFAIVGQPFTPPVVDEVVLDSAAEAAGFLPGDRVVSIDGTSIERFETIRQMVTGNLGEPMAIVVDRQGQTVALTVIPKIVEFKDRSGGIHKVGQLGIKVGGIDFARHDPVTAVWYAAKETVFLTGATLQHVGQMIAGTRSADGLSGPIGIARMSGEAAEFGIPSIVRLMALLSISLGLINLFPIPILDGGHLLYYAVEAIRGKPLGEKQQEFGFRIGLALMVLLFGFVTFNDIVRLFASSGAG